MRLYEEDYYKAYVNPNLKSSFKCWNKEQQKKRLVELNRIFKHTLNIEKYRVIIEDTHYFINEDIIGVMI